MASDQERQRLAASAWPRWEIGIYNGEPKAIDALNRLLVDMSKTWPREQPSERELEVLQGLADGNLLAGAAANLHISRETAKAHMWKVREVLGANSATHAVAIVLRRGLIR